MEKIPEFSKMTEQEMWDHIGNSGVKALYESVKHDIDKFMALFDPEEVESREMWQRTIDYIESHKNEPTN